MKLIQFYMNFYHISMNTKICLAIKNSFNKNYEINDIIEVKEENPFKVIVHRKNYSVSDTIIVNHKNFVFLPYWFLVDNKYYPHIGMKVKSKKTGDDAIITRFLPPNHIDNPNQTYEMEVELTKNKQKILISANKWLPIVNIFERGFFPVSVEEMSERMQKLYHYTIEQYHSKQKYKKESKEVKKEWGYVPSFAAYLHNPKHYFDK